MEAAWFSKTWVSYRVISWHSSLKMEAAWFSETLVSYHNPMQHHIPEYLNFKVVDLPVK
jgi:hypothetical protein